jgi:hypothetical protein
VAPERNRRSVTALNLGVQWLPHAPKDYEVLPFGALYLWRHPEAGPSRLRAVLAGLYNEVRYDVRPAWLTPTDLVLTLDNLTVPTARQEFIDGLASTRRNWNGTGCTSVSVWDGEPPWRRGTRITSSRRP